VPARPDQQNVGLTEEQLLKRFVVRRDAKDVEGARQAWEQLAEASFDRVRGMVDVRARRYGLDADERQEAVQRALVKLWSNMVRTFRGTTMGEYVNATKQLVEYACADVQRDAARRTEHETRLEDDPDKPHPGWKTDELAQQNYERDAERKDAAEFVAWAVPQLTNERRRRVAELTLKEAAAEDIAEELGVSMANLYALRSRGVKDLRKLWDGWFEA
jgi:DNA-directed RNA polymerase specialized sigma24 family protein